MGYHLHPTGALCLEVTPYHGHHHTTIMSESILLSDDPTTLECKLVECNLGMTSELHSLRKHLESQDQKFVWLCYLCFLVLLIMFGLVRKSQNVWHERARAPKPNVAPTPASEKPEPPQASPEP